MRQSELPSRPSVRLEHLRRGGIGPEDLEPGAAHAHEAERLPRRGEVGVALEVEVEDVVPRRGATRARFDLRELDRRRRPRLERAHQRAGQVLRRVDDTRLGRTRAKLRRDALGHLELALARDREEAREVVTRGLDRLCQDGKAIARRGAPACHRGDRGVAPARQIRGRTGGVVRPFPLDVPCAREERRGRGLGERARETLVGDGALTQRYTAVRHSGCRSSSPRAIAMYASPIRLPTGPMSPRPTVRPSIWTHGATCAPVPQKNTSSAMYSSVRSIGRSWTAIPSSRARARIVSRVMPSRMSAVTGGVTSAPSRTMKTFAPPPSETWPSPVRKIASSAPYSR